MNDYDIRSWLLEDNPDPVQLANKMLHIEPSIKSERDSLMNINWTTSLINETVDKKVDVYLERLEILLDQMDVCRKLCKNYEDTRDHGPNSLFDLSGKFSDYMFVPIEGASLSYAEFIDKLRRVQVFTHSIISDINACRDLKNGNDPVKIKNKLDSINGELSLNYPQYFNNFKNSEVYKWCDQKVTEVIYKKNSLKEKLKVIKDLGEKDVSDTDPEARTPLAPHVQVEQLLDEIKQLDKDNSYLWQQAVVYKNVNGYEQVNILLSKETQTISKVDQFLKTFQPYSPDDWKHPKKCSQALEIANYELAAEEYLKFLECKNNLNEGENQLNKLAETVEILKKIARYGEDPQSNDLIRLSRIAKIQEKYSIITAIHNNYINQTPYSRYRNQKLETLIHCKLDYDSAIEELMKNAQDILQKSESWQATLSQIEYLEFNLNIIKGNGLFGIRKRRNTLKRSQIIDQIASLCVKLDELAPRAELQKNIRQLYSIIEVK